MADSPPRGGRPDSPDKKPDGVVLFDPAPPPPLEPVGEEPTRSRGLVVALLFVAVAGGAYAAYQQMSEAEAPGPPPTTITGPPTRSEALEAPGGGRIEGAAGSSVPIEVRATGTDGRPLADTIVSFRVVQGGGLLELEAARTDSAGFARTLLLLPRRVGSVLLGAEVPGTRARASIVVEARSGVPSLMQMLEGDLQTAEVGELLPVRTAVQLVDEDGNPVPGADVRFEVLSGGGIAAPGRARTDSLGQASALWRLGPEPGTQELQAVSAIGAPLTFRATARGRPRAGDGTPVPVEAGPITVVRRDFVVGANHVCQLLSGATTCRGANDRLQQLQRGAQSFTGFVSLASGNDHLCGLDAQGLAMCWGANDGGQLGDGSSTDRAAPVPVRTDLRFASLTAGDVHTCGLAGGGVPLCWGQNLSGQLGDGTRNDSRFPRAVGNGITFSTLVAGWNHTCGLTANGNAFCWGLNGDGQLGDGSTFDRLLPTVVANGGGMESLAAGSAHTCGISEGQVLCWGDNRFGQLGDGSNEGRTQPTRVTGLPGRPTQIVAGAVHSCALMSDGTAYCWGQNLHGQLGDGTNQNRSSATLVAGSTRFRSIQAGGALTCGVATAGGEYCWGLNQNAQLGDGTRQSRSTPTAVRR
jgi:alpha-tubulin suppressor-like RCC1 family protein